jgi:hypothetical protein
MWQDVVLQTVLYYDFVCYYFVTFSSIFISRSISLSASERIFALIIMMLIMIRYLSLYVILPSDWISPAPGVNSSAAHSCWPRVMPWLFGLTRHSKHRVRYSAV